MQEELLRIFDETKKTVLFVTHSIPEAIRLGNRILLLTPHPGQVKAELNSLPRHHTHPAAEKELEEKINQLLFSQQDAQQHEVQHGQ